MPAKETVAAIVERKARQYPSKETRRRYQIARVRLGLSANSVGSLDWKRIAHRTTFLWKHDTFLECAQWMIRESYASMRKHPNAERSQIALHYASRAFGIAASDLMSDQRDPPFVIARFIAMVIVRRSGVGRNETARRFNRDYTVIKVAETKCAHLFEGIEYDHAPPAGNLGPASDGQSGGSISS